MSRERWNDNPVRADVQCLLATVMVSALGAWHLLRGGVLLGQDWATQFYPWYHYLGSRLSDFELPYWNPEQFSGAPFMADPQSGWTYLPAMFSFTLLPIELAAGMFAIFHLLLAGFGTYALTRALGVIPIGALVAASVYQLSGPILARSACCPAQVQVTAWIPVLLLGAELARRQSGMLRRFGGVMLASFAFSQILASWLGQGAYYAGLLLVSFLFYRTMIDRERAPIPVRNALAVFIITSASIVLIGSGLAGAGVIPRLEYNSLTNLAGGIYEWTNATLGGWSAGDNSFATMRQRFYYPGGAAVALALMAVALARLRHATPYFLFVIVTALVLGSHRETILHKVLYAVLPRFEVLHSHWPERITIVAFLGIAVLSGAAVGSLPEWRGQLRSLMLIGSIPILVAVGFQVALRPGNDHLPTEMLLGIGLTVLAVCLIGIPLPPGFTRFASIFLLILIVADFVGATRSVFAYGPYGGFYRVDLGDYFSNSGGLEFLRTQSDQPYRYFGYNPIMRNTERGQFVLYRYQFVSPETAELLVNNRATFFGGIQDIQGYNPIQFRLYVDYFQDLNGHDQDYHDSNVYPNGLDSPLLDLLNARYIIIPVTFAADRVDLEALEATLPTVYLDETVRILMRPSASEQAWLVHDVAMETPAQARALIVNDLVDPKVTGLVDGEPPVLQQRDPAVLERVEFLSGDEEQQVLKVTAGGDALLIVSEVAHPSWRATVDGEPVPILTAHGLFRSVAVPDGEHIVAFRYEGRSEHIGLLVTALTMLGTVLIAVVIGHRERTKIPIQKGSDSD